MYAPWTCTAVAPLRAELERARDARAGRLSDDAARERVDLALSRLSKAEDAHRAETGCTDMH